MVKSVLIDQTVFIDIAVRGPGAEVGREIIHAAEQGGIKGWISSLTKPLLYLSIVQQFGEMSARQMVKELTLPFVEIPLRAGLNRCALDKDTVPYLPTIQTESARQFHLDAVITWSKDDYVSSPLTSLSPQELLEILRKGDLPEVEAVPFMDLKAQHHQIYSEVDERVTDIITSTGFILGKHVEEFEARYAELQGARYCLGVSSGTDALHLALLVLGIGPGDGVIVPVNTFMATAEAVSLVGATPVFVDCDAYYNLDVESLRDLVRNSGARGPVIKAISPVHLYGQPSNMDGIMDVARQFGLAVVEDCCQAHLAQWKGVKVGNFGDFGAFSFYPGKNLGAYGEAGALTTNDEDLFRKARMVRQHGEVTRYHHELIGHNYRMEALQGAVLSAKLGHLQHWTEQRRAHASLYSELLSEVEEVEIPREQPDCCAVYHLYVIQTDARDQLRLHLQECSIATGLHYPVPLHLQPAYRFLGYGKGDFPSAERAARRILSLPMYPELSERDIRWVVSKIKDYFFRKKGRHA